jgi:flagellar basal body-associated protein FliL
MNKKKLMIIGPVVLLLVAGVAYKKVLAPKPKVIPKKIEGTLVPLDPEFVVNLAGGRYAKLSISVLSKKAIHAAAGVAPSLDQDSAVRSIITDDLTGITADRLVNKSSRADLLVEIVKDIKKQTDEEIVRVFFTDIAVQ